MKSNLSILKVFVLLVLVSSIGLAADSQAQGPQKDKPLAKIGNETITEADLDAMADAVPERFRYLYTTPEGRRQTLDYIVNVYALAAQAEKDGIAKDPKFQTLLNFTKKDLLARLYLDKQGGGIADPTDKEIKEYYDQKSDEFTNLAGVHIRHILVKTEDEAKDVLNKLKKGGKFDELAAKHSTCPSKDRGGDLGWMPRGRLVKEIEDVAFGMNKGEISGPVKTRFGYHIVLLEDKRPESKSSYDEVKDYIFDQLKYQKQQDLYEKLSDSLRKQLNVQIFMPEAPAQAVPGAPAVPAAPQPK
ncbi:MAG: peptidylprolyl isomerase [Desulfomonile sp.]|nr:peptidylprolyl isomerase [Desulfomonile sp.]